LRTSPDGAQIAFLMKDDSGIVQIWTISPNGGEPRQITHNREDIASAISWSSDGRRIAHVMAGRVCVTDVATGRTQSLTPPRTDVGVPAPLACVFSPDGRYIAYQREVVGASGSFSQIFVVDVPALDRPT
jgi:Tol biopolymer transport system component